MAKTLLVKLTRWVDSEGVERWTEMRPEVGELLEATEPKLKERLLKVPESINHVGDRSSWSGPRLKFRWLVGESRTWGDEVWLWREGLIETCPICRGAGLPTFAYCLCCDRCGRELEIPKAEKTAKAGVARFRPKGKRA